MILTLGGLGVQIDGSPRVEAAIAARFGAFASEVAPRIRLRVEEGATFEPTLELPTATSLTLDGDRLLLDGPAARGTFDVATLQGVVRDAAGLGAVDALVRAALSVMLPLDGALLLHGALVDDGRAFVGDSGAGKSTLARALGAACDEMLIARPHAGGVGLHATPYWNGRPSQLAARAIVCLERGKPEVGPLAGSAAVRTLLRHVVRFVAHPAAERAVLAIAAEVCARVPVVRAVCPTGDAFVPFARQVA
jgi:hypothetical protein